MAFKDLAQTISRIIGLGTDEYERGQDDGYDDEGYDDPAYDDGYNDSYNDGYAQEPEAYEYEEPREQPRMNMRGRASVPQEPDENVFGNRRSATRDNVVPMNGERRMTKVRIETLMPDVASVEKMDRACEALIDRMLAGQIVVISTVNVDDHQRQRMGLLLSGAAFAQKAKFRRVNAMTYVIVPDGVDFSMEEERRRPVNNGAFFDHNDFFSGAK